MSYNNGLNRTPESSGTPKPRGAIAIAILRSHAVPHWSEAQYTVGIDPDLGSDTDTDSDPDADGRFILSLPEEICHGSRETDNICVINSIKEREYHG